MIKSKLRPPQNLKSLLRKLDLETRNPLLKSVGFKIAFPASRFSTNSASLSAITKRNGTAIVYWRNTEIKNTILGRFNKSKHPTKISLPQNGNKRLFSTQIHNNSESPNPNPNPKNKQKKLLFGLIGGSILILSAYMLVSKDTLKNSTKTGEFSPFSFNKFKLLDRKKVNHDTILLRFEANGMKMSSNNTVNHICERIVGLGIWSIDIKDHYIQTFRSYTPIDSKFVGFTTHNASNLDTTINGSAGFLSKYLIAGKQFVDGLRANNSSESTQKGYFDVIVKRYPDGSVSKFIHNLKPGEYVEIRGPNLTFPYYLNTKKHIGMIAGGTGIAPMYQLLKKLLLEKPRDEIPKITLIYANKSLQDILLHDQLNKLREEFPEHLDIHYVVENISSPAENTLLNSDYRSFDPHEQFGLGIIGKDLLGKSLPPVDSSTVVLVSGPDGMMDHICGMKPIDGQQGPLSGILKGLGYSSEMVYKM